MPENDSFPAAATVPSPAVLERRYGGASGILLLSLALGALAAALAAAAVLAVPPPATQPFPVTLRVESGASAAEIGRLLQEHGLVSSARVFALYARLRGQATSLQAGLYRFEEPMGIPEIAAKFLAGSPDYMEITVPEGLTIWETAALLSEYELADVEAFIAAFSGPSAAAHLAPEAATLEGYLFPDTYRISPSETPERIARLMVSEFERRFMPLWESRPADWKLTLHETVTLASLIEKETRHGDERPLVASVYLNRLRRGMLLQCDPTVIYAMKMEGAYRGRLYRKYLKEVESPYNTYLFPGLPPGPIASGGLGSLRAALAPEVTPYIFFVARADGRHQFSATLDEHNRAVRLWRRSRMNAGGVGNGVEGAS